MGAIGVPAFPMGIRRYGRPGEKVWPATPNQTCAPNATDTVRISMVTVAENMEYFNQSPYYIGQSIVSSEFIKIFNVSLIVLSIGTLIELNNQDNPTSKRLKYLTFSVIFVSIHSCIIPVFYKLNVYFYLIRSAIFVLGK